MLRIPTGFLTHVSKRAIVYLLNTFEPDDLELRQYTFTAANFNNTTIAVLRHAFNANLIFDFSQGIRMILTSSPEL